MKQPSALLLAAPLVIFDILIFATSIIYVIGMSFTGGDNFLQNYFDVAQDPLFQSVLFRTLWISALAALISLGLGFVLAYHLWISDGRTRAYLTLVVISPLLVSVVVRTFGWIVLLGSSGPLFKGLALVGIEDFRLLYTASGVVTALVHVHLPYAVLAILAALDSINPDLLRASRSLGANSAQVFSSVVLPLAFPGVVAGGLLAFVLNVGSFVTPVLIGGPRQLTLGGYVHQELMIFFHEGTGYAGSVITLVLTASVIGALTGLGRRRQWQLSTAGA